MLNSKGCYWTRAKQYTSKNSIRPFWDPERKALMMTLLMLWVGLVGSYCILQRLPWQHQGKQELKTSPTAEKKWRKFSETKNWNHDHESRTKKTLVNIHVFFQCSQSQLTANFPQKKLTEQTWVTNWWYRCTTQEMYYFTKQLTIPVRIRILKV